MFSFEEARALKRFANQYGKPMRASFIKWYLMMLADADEDGELTHPRATLNQYASMSGVSQKTWRFDMRVNYFVEYCVSHGLLALSRTPFRALLLVDGQPWPTLKYGLLCPIVTQEGALGRAFNVVTREYVPPPDIRRRFQTVTVGRTWGAWRHFTTPTAEVITVPDEQLEVGVKCITFSSAALPPFVGIDDGFFRFWEAYGYKSKKDEAMEVWLRLGLHRYASEIIKAAFLWSQSNVVLPRPAEFLELGYWKNPPPEGEGFTPREFRPQHDRQYLVMKEAARLLHEPVGDIRLVQHYLAYLLGTKKWLSYEEFVQEYRRDRRRMLGLLYGRKKKRRKPD